jgi:hypothetical protein
MTVKAIRGWAVALPLILSCGAGLSSPARADSLNIQQTPVTNAIAELDHSFGVTVVVKGTVDPETPVSVSLDDTSAPGAALDAINQLSNDIGATFQKSYVISRLPSSEPVPSVHVDSTTEIYFGDNSVDAEGAIQRIAHLDAADISYVDPVSGTIFLSDTDFTLPDAANEVARLTHTRWQAVYTLTLGSESNPTQGKVVDRTNEGQPIVQLPYSEYDAPLPKPAPAADTKAGKNSGSKTAASNGTDNSANAAVPFDPNSLMPANSGTYLVPALGGGYDYMLPTLNNSYNSNGNVSSGYNNGGFTQVAPNPLTDSP